MRLLRWVVASGLAWVAAAGSVWAQAPPPRADRPYRGLFGGGVGDTDESLMLNASVGGGYDDDVLGVEGDATAPTGAIGGTYEQLDARLAYALRRTRGGIAASADTSIRRDSVTSDVLAGHSGSFGAWMQMSPRTRLTASQTMTYQPFYTLSLFPTVVQPGLAEASAPDPSLGILRQQYVSYSSALDFTHGLSSRASVSASYGYFRTDFGGDDGDFRSQRAGLLFSRGVSDRLALKLGYDYQRGIYDLGADVAQVIDHTLVVGLTYSRRISAFSRTTMSIEAGPSVISEGGRPYYRPTVGAALMREIGRTWDVALSYDRRPRLVETFTAPVLEDGLTASIGGMINQRVALRSTIGVTIGDIGVTATNHLTTTYGTTSLIVGLTRSVGLGVDYSSLRYSFNNEAFLPAGLPTALDRQRVGVHLELWAPLIHRGSKTDVAR